MTTPIDDMLQNLIEKLHAARFVEASPTIADLHQVATALVDTRRMVERTPSSDRLDHLEARVGKLEAPCTDDLAKGIAEDMRKLAALRDIPVMPDRIATSTGEDLDEVADALGLSRKGWPYHEAETDDALRVRCAAALFGQSMTRELAESIARQAAINGMKSPSAPGYLWNADGDTWKPHDWVIDAVMAAAGVHPDGRPLDQHGDLAVAMERDLTVALGYVPETVSWQRCLDLVRETITQREAANAALKAERENDYRKQRDKLVNVMVLKDQCIFMLEERNATQAKTIEELQNTEARTLALQVVEQKLSEAQKLNDSLRAQCDGLGRAIDARGQALRLTLASRDTAERTVVDQAAQIAELRAEAKRLVKLDGVKMTDAEVAALTGAT
jgi:hypothetical protein